MKNYIAFWPDETFTVLSASSPLDLFWSLDEEGNPEDAEVYRLAGKFSVKIWGIPELISAQDIKVDGLRERVSFKELFQMEISTHPTP